MPPTKSKSRSSNHHHIASSTSPSTITAAVNNANATLEDVMNPLPPPPPHTLTPTINSAMGVGGSMGGSQDDADNRTRNAKAQRRHREKRKAHLKALEESVQVLTAQLDDARRQLGQAAYYNSQRPPGALPHGPPLSPQSKDFTQLQSENAYLRDENADLRRQLYSYRVNYPPHTPVEGKEGWEVKPDGGNGGGFGVYPGGGMSPRRSGVSRASGDMPGVDPQLGADGGPSSASSSSGNYPPVEHFTPIHQRSRSRVMSTGSGPGASPYMNNEGPGPRGMDGRYPPPQSMRYEPQTPVGYPAPPPHNMPQQRYDMGSTNQQGGQGGQGQGGQGGHGHSYTPRQEGGAHESVSWPPEQSGPPPFTGYPSMGFGHENQGEEWRQQDH